jgi:hypothetical protein
VYLHGGGDRLLWGFGRLSKFGKTKRSTNEMREAERGSESTGASQNRRCSACHTLPHPYTKPPTCHALRTGGGLVCENSLTMTRQLPASRRADMAPKKDTGARARVAVLCYVVLRRATSTFVHFEPHTVLESRVLTLNEFIILLVITS